MQCRKLIALTALLTFGGMALSAQATTMKNSSNDELTKIIYSCDKKQTLEVIFLNTEKNAYAIINQVDEMIPMEAVPSASGAVYKAINKNYHYELATKGDTATLFGDEGKAIVSGCVNH